ncbi:hypothetical protein [Scytonema sp. NUACC21]
MESWILVLVPIAKLGVSHSFEDPRFPVFAKPSPVDPVRVGKPNQALREPALL